MEPRAKHRFLTSEPQRLGHAGEADTQAGSLAFYVSFSDLMVVLTSLFVLFLSMSQVQVGGFEQIKVGFSGRTEGTLVALAESLKAIAAEQTGVSVDMAQDGVRLDLESAVLFDTGSAVLKASSLDSLAPLFAEIRQTSYTIDVEGHTDDENYFRRRGGLIETNWSLSGQRASSLVTHLMSLGIAESRLRIVGYASNRPKVPPEGLKGQALSEARALNRRVSILVH